MKNNESPIAIFSKWFNEECELTKVKIPSAVCLSTVGIDNFPNARFVSFKEIIDNAFIVTGPLNSRKGIEINSNNQVAMTFWWAETERQIRVQGIANPIDNKLADKYFEERNINAKAVSYICEQGKELNNIAFLEKSIEDKVAEGKRIDRPSNWGGFAIKPIRIEFMEFKETRFHHRKLYEFHDGTWSMKQLQP